MAKVFVFYEHFDGLSEDKELQLDKACVHYFKRKGKTEKCAVIVPESEGCRVSLSYYIGVDWISRKDNMVIYVEPKLDKTGKCMDYLQMLFAVCRHPEVVGHIGELFEIKYEEPFIEIDQKKDLLTPFLVILFLQLVKVIVKKGLKKTYYKEEKNLFSRVKGKVLVSRTIKTNLAQNKPLYTSCRYDEFGVNGPENRLLKKALQYVKRYLPLMGRQTEEQLKPIFNFVMPAFEKVSDFIGQKEIKYAETKLMFKEYEEALKLARLILKRFGYNINMIDETESISVPPFWVDMSKLFELYVLGLLKDRFGEKVSYHFTSKRNELDYLIHTEAYQMVVDAKYKPQYSKSYEIDDVRQVSGYARLKDVYWKLHKPLNEVIDCLIIYPEQLQQNTPTTTLKDCDLKAEPIDGFVNIYKLGVKLPEQYY